MSVQNPRYHVSLKGAIDDVKLTNMGDNVSSVLKAFWVEVKSLMSFGSQHKMDHGCGHGYNFSQQSAYHEFTSEVYQYYFVAYQFRYANINIDKLAQMGGAKSKRLGSWNEAYNICKSRGGYLPIIRSKMEQDELIRYIKLVKYTPPVNILYIGLQVNLVSWTLRMSSHETEMQGQKKVGI